MSTLLTPPPRLTPDSKSRRGIETAHGKDTSHGLLSAAAAPSPHHLAGDIGGTKSWLILFSRNDAGALESIFEKRYPSHQFSQVSSLLQHFLSEAPVQFSTIDSAVLALPGPIIAGRCQLTNLNWVVDSKELKNTFSISRLTLKNDFQAASTGIATLTSHDMIALNQAKSTDMGIRVVTGAGTGLGLSWMQWQNGGYQTFATEGGHTDFAPGSPLQLTLLHYIYERDSAPVPYEQLLSGSGLETIYYFCCHQNGHEVTACGAAQITALALQQDAVATAAVELFIEIYGAWIGNLALLYRPTGGIFIAGGIAAKMASWMQSDRFIQACYNKGKMSILVTQTPLFLVTNERLGLQGAIDMLLGQETGED